MTTTEMSYRSLGCCGTKVSIFGLGGWLTFGKTVNDKQDIRGMLHAAYQAGINFFDIADGYATGEAEKAMGEVLCEFPRHQLVISSKVFFPMSDDVNDRGLSRKHIMESIEKSLKRIGTDYLDIFFCHRFDEETPIEETARAMDDLIHQGKILYWGTSEWSGAQIHELHSLCKQNNLYCPQVEQPHYNLLARSRFENEIRPAAAKLGMGLVVWSPLAMGILTGKYDRGMPEDSRMAKEEWLQPGRYTDENLQKVRQFKKVTDDLGCSRAQLALAWTAAQEGVSSVISGANGIEQLQENLQAISVNLSEDVLQSLSNLFPG